MYQYHYLTFIFSVFAIYHAQCAQISSKNSRKRNPYPYVLTPGRTQEENKRPLLPLAIVEIFRSAREGNLGRLEEMLEEYGNLDEPLNGFTGIYHATFAGNLKSVEFFTNAGAQMTRLYPASPRTKQSTDNLEDEFPSVVSLLDIAIERDHKDIALFLAQHIPLSLPNGRGELPLCNALRYHRPLIAFALMKSNESYGTYLSLLERTNQPETALSCARRLEYHDLADIITIALQQSTALAKKEDSQAASVRGEKNSLLSSRWVVIPGLCVLTIGALYIIKAHASKPFSESLRNFLPSYRA